MRHDDGRSVSECRENQDQTASWARFAPRLLAGSRDMASWASTGSRKTLLSAPTRAHSGNVGLMSRSQNLAFEAYTGQKTRPRDVGQLGGLP